MSDSLRDQLLGLGFQSTSKPAAVAKPQTKSTRTPERQAPVPKPHAAAGRSRAEIELAMAYALRADTEKKARIEAERLKQEAARFRREAKIKLEQLLVGNSLNDAAAEITRHFPYGGKIKRIHVTAEQLSALNSGKLGVVQMSGRYLLVNAAVLADAEAIFAEAIALRVDPNAPAADDVHADPQYQVPDDLVW